MNKVIMAFQFLTIIPVTDLGKITEAEMGKTTRFFPLVGLAEGIVLAFAASLMLKVFPAELTNAFLILFLAIINGGLHLDGLADSFDAIASRGSREKKLAVMKDSFIGPIGVISIVMALLIMYALLNAVISSTTTGAYLSALILTPVVSRWSMVPAAYYGRSARKDGLGRVFIEHTELRDFVIATGIVFIIVLAISAVFSFSSLFLFYCMAPFPALYLFSIITVWFSGKSFDGITGDVFGAVNEISKIIFLTTMVIWLQQSS